MHPQLAAKHLQDSERHMVIGDKHRIRNVAAGKHLARRFRRLFGQEITDPAGEQLASMRGKTYPPIPLWLT